MKFESKIFRFYAHNNDFLISFKRLMAQHFCLKDRVQGLPHTLQNAADYGSEMLQRIC